jgi:hypothetical protein
MGTLMTTATLESPPRSGNRTVFTITFHGKDGSERQKYSIKKSGVLKFGIAATVVWLLASTGGDELGKWARRQDADSLKPKMEALANQGQDEAALWMMKHYWAANKQRLAPLAAKGNPEAMFQQGLLQMRSGDKDSGMRWVEKSAAVGCAEAVQYIERAKKH